MLGHYFKRRRQFVEMITMSGEGVGVALFSVILKEGVGWVKTCFHSIKIIYFWWRFSFVCFFFVFLDFIFCSFKESYKNAVNIPLSLCKNKHFTSVFHFFFFRLSKMGWRLGLQAVTGLVSISFFMGLLYRPASLYHPQRRAILHLKNQRKKVIYDVIFFKRENERMFFFVVLFLFLLPNRCYILVSASKLYA